jgi:NAD(P)-dependent dehydrogenase (short-subunit alcohol dehydrogenase family)
MTTLTGAVALVTGASGAIGRELCRSALQRGYVVVGLIPPGDPASTDLRDLLAAAGARSRIITADVSDAAAVSNAIEDVLAREGRIDLLINNAAVFRSIGPLWSADPARWFTDVNVNLVGAFNVTRYALEPMIARGRGAVITLVGGGFDGPNLGGTSYAASKAGLARLVDTLAEELDAAGHDIRVHALMPGLVRSSMTEALAADESGRRWLPQVAGGFGTSEEVSATRVGEAVLELAARADDIPNGRIVRWDDDLDAVIAAIRSGDARYRIVWSRPEDER